MQTQDFIRELGGVYAWDLATVGDTCLKYMYQGLAVNAVRTAQLIAKHGHVTAAPPYPIKLMGWSANHGIDCPITQKQTVAIVSYIG